MLNLNGHTVQCTIANISFGAVVEVIGTNNAVKGPGTREYIHICEVAHWILILNCLL